ncbi:hypothetical protein T484DRAFT_1756666 [Baffinella frigidus]|nr:hypothetical protein T484DRAFT_1756666 [Cryptophyta sp. CCMP2293]
MNNIMKAFRRASGSFLFERPDSPEQQDPHLPTLSLQSHESETSGRPTATRIEPCDRAVPRSSARSFDPATMELPRVSLSFLPADYEHTPDDCRDPEEWKACEDGLFRGRRRSDQDLAAMLAWLEE